MPRYRSVVWTDAWPEQQLNLLQFAAGCPAHLRAAAPQIMRGDSGKAGCFRIGPQKLPDDLLAQCCSPGLGRLGSLAGIRDPPVKPTAEVHPSIATLVHVGIGTVRTRPCLPTRSTIHHRPSRC